MQAKPYSLRKQWPIGVALVTFAIIAVVLLFADGRLASTAPLPLPANKEMRAQPEAPLQVSGEPRVERVDGSRVSGLGQTVAVLDSQQNPIAGATVQGLDWRTSPQTVIECECTNASGESLLGEGVQYAIAFADGYRPSGGAILTGSRNKTTLVLERGAELRGRVSTVDGSPIEGVEVRISAPGMLSASSGRRVQVDANTKNIRQSLSIVTDASGKFEALGLEGGDYIATWGKVGFVPSVDPQRQYSGSGLHNCEVVSMGREDKVAVEFHMKELYVGVIAIALDSNLPAETSKWATASSIGYLTGLAESLSLFPADNRAAKSAIEKRAVSAGRLPDRAQLDCLLAIDGIAGANDHAAPQVVPDRIASYALHWLGQESKSGRIKLVPYRQWDPTMILELHVGSATANGTILLKSSYAVEIFGQNKGTIRHLPAEPREYGATESMRLVVPEGNYRIMPPLNGMLDARKRMKVVYVKAGVEESVVMDLDDTVMVQLSVVDRLSVPTNAFCITLLGPGAPVRMTPDTADPIRLTLERGSEYTWTVWDKGMAESRTYKATYTTNATSILMVP